MSHVQAENETPGTDTIVAKTHATNISSSIGEEFHSLLPDPGAEAVRQLTDSLLTEGCREPLIVWEYDGQHLLLDGHHRHSICAAHHLPYQVVVKTVVEIPDRHAAMDWIDHNQLARGNLTPEQFTLVLGRLYSHRKQAHGGDRKSSGENDHLIANAGKTAEKLSNMTVCRCGSPWEAQQRLPPFSISRQRQRNAVQQKLLQEF